MDTRYLIDAIVQLSESVSERGATLWQSVLEHVDRNGPLSRAQLERATNATPEAVEDALSSLLADGRLVQALLADTRRRVNALWQRVEDYDRAHPSEVAKTKLTFYYGQTMDGPPIHAPARSGQQDVPGEGGQQKGECDA